MHIIFYLIELNRTEFVYIPWIQIQVTPQDMEQVKYKYIICNT
jgi:hypothetical protein